MDKEAKQNAEMLRKQLHVPTFNVKSLQDAIERLNSSIEALKRLVTRDDAANIISRQFEADLIMSI